MNRKQITAWACAALFGWLSMSCAASSQRQRQDGGTDPDATATSCGDLILQTGEGCDDGNLLDGDGCSPTCQVEPGWACSGEPSLCVSLCGNGNLDSGEECDGVNLGGNDCTTLGAGFTSGTLVCLASCRFDSTGCRLATCGNGTVDTGEQCDDGNTSNTDACMNNCQEAQCGDGYVWQGVEVCDDGNSSNSDDCLDTCEAASCGDGFTWTGHEVCDDGNASDTDACLVGCVAARCGDGHVWAGQEACDDGNTTVGDGCSATCTVEPIPTLHFATGQPAIWGSLPLPWAGQPHAPSTPIVAAADMDQRDRAVLFTTTTWHELSLPSHQWLGSGSLSSKFPGVPGGSLLAAWGVSWPADAASSVTLITYEGAAGARMYSYSIDNTTGVVTPNVANPQALDLSGDPLAPPNPANVKAAFLPLSNANGWTSCVPSDLCAAGGATLGPYMGIVTTDNNLYLMESGYCWVFYAQMPLSQFPPFTAAGAPQPAKVVAMFYSTDHGNRLYAIAVP